MTPRRGPEGSRVLVAAPFGQDADNVTRLLAEHGFQAQVAPDADAIATLLDDRTGVVLITEEALRGDLLPLRAALEAQPAWSDTPFILLISRNSYRPRTGELARLALADLTTNLIVLERPLGSASLVSAVDMAMRARRRQFDLRDRLRELDENRAMLEDRVRERTAALEAEMDRRAEAEAALRQSQKMEAVGQLTGGIAHDFNNMLTGVIGALDVVKRKRAAGKDGDTDRYLETAQVSAQRAASLTHRLLAFSRRQTLDPHALDINAMVSSLQDLIQRTVTEQITVSVDLSAAEPAVADANQLESAILNLAINARDAMPEGGRLVLSTSVEVLDAAAAAETPDTAPGRYVVIVVTDTGVGMAPDILEKVFDPFFTTKPIGQGTGLGLSMVYGFARQTGGTVRILSRPGEGTSVRIYLPVADRAADPIVAESQTALTRGGGQTVLLVEDEGAVRLLVREVLEDLGYRAIEASDPQSAISILKASGSIDLMISDVGLPGMNGRQLAEVARDNRPDLPILFITGYAENAAIRADFLGSNMEMIAKPFALDALAAKISEMMPA